MPLGSTTLGSGATKLTSGPQRAMQLLLWQGADASFFGDSTVSSSNGLPIAVASTTVQPTRIGPFTSGAINLNQVYVAGTSTDKVYWYYTPEE